MVPGHAAMSLKCPDRESGSETEHVADKARRYQVPSVSPVVLHTSIDLAAFAAAAMAGVVVYRAMFPLEYKHPVMAGYRNYLLALSVGALAGAILLGSLNLWASDILGFGRSILGAILGAILGVEWYKRRHALYGSTGAALVIPLAVGITVGRIGCFLAGMDDYTYGTPTDLPWGHDFGDGVARHPVQLYEAAAATLGAGLFLVLLRKRPDVAISMGFYFFVAWYGTQRFMLEFLKPYGSVMGSLNVFHLGCMLLIAYAVVMIGEARHASA